MLITAAIYHGGFCSEFCIEPSLLMARPAFMKLHDHVLPGNHQYALWVLPFELGKAAWL